MRTVPAAWPVACGGNSRKAPELAVEMRLVRIACRSRKPGEIARAFASKCLQNGRKAAQANILARRHANGIPEQCNEMAAAEFVPEVRNTRPRPFHLHKAAGHCRVHQQRPPDARGQLAFENRKSFRWTGSCAKPLMQHEGAALPNRFQLHMSIDERGGGIAKNGTGASGLECDTDGDTRLLGAARVKCGVRPMNDAARPGHLLGALRPPAREPSAGQRKHQRCGARRQHAFERCSLPTGGPPKTVHHLIEGWCRAVSNEQHRTFLCVAGCSLVQRGREEYRLMTVGIFRLFQLLQLRYVESGAEVGNADGTQAETGTVNPIPQLRSARRDAGRKPQIPADEMSKLLWVFAGIWINCPVFRHTTRSLGRLPFVAWKRR